MPARVQQLRSRAPSMRASHAWRGWQGGGGARLDKGEVAQHCERGPVDACGAMDVHSLAHSEQKRKLADLHACTLLHACAQFMRAMHEQPPVRPASGGSIWHYCCELEPFHTARKRDEAGACIWPGRETRMGHQSRPRALASIAAPRPHKLQSDRAGVMRSCMRRCVLPRGS